MVKRRSILASAMALALSACGGGGGGGTGSVASTAPATASTAVVVVPTAATSSSTTTTTTPAATPASTAPVACPVTIGGVDYYLSSLEKPAYACTAPSDSVQRFEVRSGDHGYSGDVTNNAERSELVTTNLTGTQRNRIYPLNTDVWISYSFMIEAGDTITAPWTITGQFHPVPDATDVGLSPDVALGILPGAGNQMVLATRSDANPSPP